MSDNPHVKQTIDALNALNKAMNPSEAMALTAVQAQATLALAYEQRTANLIAYEAGLAQAFRDNAINENGFRLWKLATDEVHERIGLS